MQTGSIAAVAEFVTPPAVYRFSVEQYHRLVNAGVLSDGDPVELVEGLLVRKMTKNPLHVSVAELIRDYLATRIGPGYILRTESPVTLRESEPEPDVVLVRGSRADYFERHPNATEVELLIEVSDSTLGYDRGAKKRMYAREGVRRYWVVNLIDRRVEAYSDPAFVADVHDYSTCETYRGGDSVSLSVGNLVLAIPVAEIIPAARNEHGK